MGRSMPVRAKRSHPALKHGVTPPLPTSFLEKVPQRPQRAGAELTLGASTIRVGLRALADDRYDIGEPVKATQLCGTCRRAAVAQQGAPPCAARRHGTRFRRGSSQDRPRPPIWTHRRSKSGEEDAPRGQVSATGFHRRYRRGADDIDACVICRCPIGLGRNAGPIQMIGGPLTAATRCDSRAFLSLLLL